MSSLESKLEKILGRLSAAEAKRAAAKADLARRIVYIDGLDLDADDHVVLSAFESGDVEDLCLLEKYKNWGMKSWIWMVLFKNSEAAIRAVKQPHKTIGAQLVSCRLASDLPSNTAAAAPSNTQQP